MSEQFATDQKPKATKKAGIIFLILSCVCYCVPFIAPFIPFSTNTKLIIAASFAVLGEIMFWIGCIIVGKELMKRYRKYLP